MSEGGDGDGPVGEDRSNGMTLAFDLAAIESFASPRAVVTDARAWSRHVGVVANDAAAVESFARRWGIRQDFEIGDLDRRSVLSRLLWEADTDRFVLVGGDEVTSDLADHVGWEYVPVEEAAEKAGWVLLEDAGTVNRLRARLSRRLLSLFPVG